MGSGRGTPGLLRESGFLLLRLAPSGQGKAGATWGCRPTEHPLPTPAGNPAGSRICSDLALARSIFRENRRVPQAARQAPLRPSFELCTYLRAACKPFCLREKSFAPPARWARLSAAKGRAVARRVVCLEDVRGPRGRCARDAKGERKAAARGAWRSAASAQRSPQAPAVRRPWCFRTEGPRRFGERKYFPESWIALLSISVRPARTSFREPNGYGPSGRLRSASLRLCRLLGC